MKNCVYIFIGLLTLFASCFDQGNIDPVNDQTVNKGPVLPVIETGTPMLISGTEIKIVAQISDVGKKPIIEHGHTWSTDQSQESLDGA